MVELSILITSTVHTVPLLKSIHSLCYLIVQQAGIVCAKTSFNALHSTYFVMTVFVLRKTIFGPMLPDLDF